jgi:hypothetical protein
MRIFERGQAGVKQSETRCHKPRTTKRGRL